MHLCTRVCEIESRTDACCGKMAMAHGTTAQMMAKETASSTPRAAAGLRMRAATGPASTGVSVSRPMVHTTRATEHSRSAKRAAATLSPRGVPG